MEILEFETWKCPKCGYRLDPSGEQTLELGLIIYHEAGSRCLPALSSVMVEHLHIECQRCKYEWATSTRDATLA